LLQFVVQVHPGRKEERNLLLVLNLLITPLAIYVVYKLW